MKKVLRHKLKKKILKGKIIIFYFDFPPSDGQRREDGGQVVRDRRRQLAIWKEYSNSRVIP